LSERIGGLLTLDEIPNSELDKFSRSGFQWIWLTNVCQTGSDLRDDIWRKIIYCCTGTGFQGLKNNSNKLLDT